MLWIFTNKMILSMSRLIISISRRCFNSHFKKIYKNFRCSWYFTRYFDKPYFQSWKNRNCNFSWSIRKLNIFSLIQSYILSEQHYGYFGVEHSGLLLKAILPWVTLQTTPSAILRVVFTTNFCCQKEKKNNSTKKLN